MSITVVTGALHGALDVLVARDAVGNGLASEPFDEPAPALGALLGHRLEDQPAAIDHEHPEAAAEFGGAL
jgi:hypothetical protein